MLTQNRVGKLSLLLSSRLRLEGAGDRKMALKHYVIRYQLQLINRT
jgi:hypothetical protein